MADQLQYISWAFKCHKISVFIAIFYDLCDLA